MKLIFLGTNGWYDTDMGSAVSALIDTEKFAVVLDAGFGIYKLKEHVSAEKPVYLFLSHLHLDHICGLHTLISFKFKSLEIFCGKGIKKQLEIILDHPFTVPLSNLPYPVKITELEPGKHTLPFQFECLPLKHADPSMGYRLYLEEKTIAYCTDTAICENDLLLAKEADILVHECSFLPGFESAWGHANPEQAAKLAKDANAKKLILTHFTADSYKDRETRKRSETSARKIFPATIAANDGLIIKI